MKIATMKARLDFWKYGFEEQLRPELKFRLETQDGQVFTFAERLMNNSDLTSNFDYLWKRLGETFKKGLSRADEKTRPEGEPQGGTSQVSTL